MKRAGGDNLFTLRQVLDTVGLAVQLAMPDRVWLVAEIAQVSSSKGHVYLELVQKEGGSLVAKSRAMIWQSQARLVLGAFSAETGQTLAAGMSALLCVSVAWHSVYGLSLTVHGIDASYTMGEMARQKREVVERLTREGVIERNKGIEMPVAPLRIAIVSSRTAAGYEDFVHQLVSNASGFQFVHRLFEASVQGDGAERSLTAALREARRCAHRFDVAVLIRGGGSKVDLHCFDTYSLALEIATFPLPVICGIGHERDESVADMVSHHRCKTPTAVAEFLIARVLDFDEKLLDLQAGLIRQATAQMDACRHQIDAAARRLQTGVLQAVSRRTQELTSRQEALRASLHLRIEREKGMIERLGDKIKLLDPVHVLRRGYSLVYAGDALVRSIGQVEIGGSIDIRVADGRISSTVDDTESLEEMTEDAV